MIIYQYFTVFDNFLNSKIVSIPSIIHWNIFSWDLKGKYFPLEMIHEVFVLSLSTQKKLFLIVLNSKPYIEYKRTNM